MPNLQATDSTTLVTNSILVTRRVAGEIVQRRAQMEINAVSTADGETHYGVPHFTCAENIVLTNLEKNILLIGENITRPVVVDAPYASQTDNILACTKGNWEESPEPDDFSYQWQMGGINVGVPADTYLIMPEQIGGVFTCVVTAYNAMGTTSSTSNEVVATA